jgi:hypothetical protein
MTIPLIGQVPPPPVARMLDLLHVEELLLAPKPDSE